MATPLGLHMTEFLKPCQDGVAHLLDQWGFPKHAVIDSPMSKPVLRRFVAEADSCAEHGHRGCHGRGPFWHGR